MNVSTIKKNWNWIILGIILLLGLWLRVYHIDYPVVGYHNWKEVHYLTEARNFARDGLFENGFLIPEWDYPKPGADPSGAHSDTIPTISIAMAAGFLIFGEDLAVARGINILFALGSVFFFYLVIKKLFKREDLALTSALLMSFNPLLVFFGRQTQLVNPALFFVLMGTYFYLLYLKDMTWKNLFLFSIPMILGAMTKYPTALLVAPAFFIFPFKKLKEKSKWKQYGTIGIIGLIFASWLPYTFRFSNEITKQVTAVKLDLIFKDSFWRVMKAFAADNFALITLWFALFGVVMFFILYKKNKESQGYKYMFWYLLFSIPWFVVMASKMQGHNYHQYPIMPLIVFFTAFGITFIATNISSIFKFKYIKYPAILLMFFLVLGPMVDAKNRMFDTQFPGLDVAGEYIKENKIEGERVQHSSHQAYGVLWHGDIKGTQGIRKDLEDFKYAEEELNAVWLFMYEWDFEILQREELWNHIKNNYELKQIGFIGSQPKYMLFKLGGTFDETKINEYIKGHEVQTREYELSRGNIVLQYVNLD